MAAVIGVVTPEVEAPGRLLEAAKAQVVAMGVEGRRDTQNRHPRRSSPPNHQRVHRIDSSVPIPEGVVEGLEKGLGRTPLDPGKIRT